MPIQTPQQFYDWFAQVDRSVAHSQEAHFRAHVATVAEHLSTADMLLERLDEVEKEVDSMLEGWRGVEEGGRSLKDACERLLEDRVSCYFLARSFTDVLPDWSQDKLLDLTDEIDTRLEYFQELEHATRMLNHPGESLVLQTDFLYMVERVDICIEYLKAHVGAFTSRINAPVLRISYLATLQGSRGLPIALPAMHDTRHDTHQDVLCRLPQSSHSRHIEAIV